MVRITQNNHFFTSSPLTCLSLNFSRPILVRKYHSESIRPCEHIKFLRPSDTFCFWSQKENRPFPFLGKICISFLCFLYRVFMKNCGFSKILKNIPDSWSVSVCSGLFRRCTCVYVRQGPPIGRSGASVASRTGRVQKNDNFSNTLLNEHPVL